jgi:hypothetical protein
VSRFDTQRLEDIRAACTASGDHPDHGDLGQGLIFDAVLFRLIEIGDAVKAFDPDLLATTSTLPTPSWPARSGRTYPSSKPPSTGSPPRHAPTTADRRPCPPKRPPANRGQQPSPHAKALS